MARKLKEWEARRRKGARCSDTYVVVATDPPSGVGQDATDFRRYRDAKANARETCRGKVLWSSARGFEPAGAIVKCEGEPVYACAPPGAPLYRDDQPPAGRPPPPPPAKRITPEQESRFRQRLLEEGVWDETVRTMSTAAVSNEARERGWISGLGKFRQSMSQRGLGRRRRRSPMRRFKVYPEDPLRQEKPRCKWGRVTRGPRKGECLKQRRRKRRKR